MKNFGNEKGVFVNLRIGLFLAVSLAFGIGFSYYIFAKNIAPCLICFISFIAFLLVSVFLGFKSDKKQFRLIMILAFLLSFCVGALSFSASVNKYQKADLGNHYTTITGSVKTITQTENGYTLVLNKASATLYGQELNYNVKVYVNGNIDLELGDKIEFSAYLYDKEAFYDGRIASYDISAKIKWNASVSASEVEVLSHSPNVFQSINIFIKNTLKKGLNDKEFTVAYALLTGDSNLIEEDVITSFRQAGVAHIFAVSGLHIGFLATAITYILSKLKTNKKLRIVILVACLFTYSGVCGFSSSSIRASIMCSIASLLRLFGKRYDGLNAVGVAGLLILALSPLQMFCAGFVLSFGVVIGILIMQNPLEKFFLFLPEKLASAFALVISAQLASIPISIAFFRTFSLISVLANLLFVPLVAIVFYVLLAGVILGGIFSIPTITLFPSGIMLKALVFVITIFDYQIFIVGGIVLGGFAIFYYLALFVLSGMVNLKTVTRRIVSLILMTVCVLGVHFNTKITSKQVTAYVTSTTTLSATLIQANESTLVVSYAKSGFSANALKRLINKLGIEKIDNLLVTSGASNLDLQNLVTAFNHYVDFGYVYYYGQKQNQQELIIQNSFPNVQLQNFVDGRVNIQGVNIESKGEGKGILITTNKSKILVLSALDSISSNLGFTQNDLDLLVTRDLCTSLEQSFKPKQVICYLSCYEHKNAVNSGILTFDMGKGN